MRRSVRKRGGHHVRVRGGVCGVEGVYVHEVHQNSPHKIETGTMEMIDIEVGE